MMIKKLILRNFESHKKAIIPFHEGLNVIVGTSDSGKSGLIRALDWALNNRPQGNSFVRNKTGITSVKAIFTNGKIKRIKGPKKNEYQTILDGKIEKFHAFKSNVPEEVQLVANMDSINWKKQFDPHFLLSLTPPAVAKELNSIVGLEEIDSSIRIINNRNLKTVQLIRFTKGQVTEIEETLEDYKNLDRVEKLIKKAESLSRERYLITKQIERLEWLRIQLEDWEEHSNQKKIEVKKVKKLLSELEELHEGLSDISCDIKDLQELRTQYRVELKRKKEAKSELKKLNKQMPKVCASCGSQL